MHVTLTCALDTISNPASSAATFETSCCVDTFGVSVAVMGSNLTLIDICKNTEMFEELMDQTFSYPDK